MEEREEKRELRHVHCGNLEGLGTWTTMRHYMGPDNKAEVERGVH